jgi:uncharacterized membrane protein
MIVAEFFVACPAWFALFQPSGTIMNVWGAALAVIMLIFAVNLIHLGQGGSRDALPASAEADGDHTPDACWKWGVFYFNPADPAILIEKRFGIGYTLNLGNRWSWGVLAVLILVPLALAGLLLR